MGQDDLQDVSKTTSMAPRQSKMAPRCLEDGPKMPARPPRWPKRAQGGSRSPHEAPKTAQEASK
eukprot:8769050-Pyramimonas_sp.AAC.1